MTARFIVADVHDGLNMLDDGSVDLALFSPPFWSVRSYLPADHPLKSKELGSEATPADFLDNLLDVIEALAPKLAPHGSIAVELGDTYAGSGGGGGDYLPGGLREGQQQFAGSAASMRESNAAYWRQKNAWRGNIGEDGEPLGGRQPRTGRYAVPLDKSLCGIPDAFALSLAYGWNMLRPERTTPKWRVRNKKAWVRTNPPVGALGDKERPATSYITVATKARDRWFDLDAVRSPGASYNGSTDGTNVGRKMDPEVDQVASAWHDRKAELPLETNPAGAPPLDWWSHIDAILDRELARRNAEGGKPYSRTNPKYESLNASPPVGNTPTATGAHLRRALQAAGILTLEDAIDQSPGGYSGAHYAVWPPELVAQLIAEMCPRQVCRQCGEPRRRIGGKATYEPSASYRGGVTWPNNDGRVAPGVNQHVGPEGQGKASLTRVAPTLGWSDCGHDDWRPGLVLDPFVGSGTTLMVAMYADPPRDATGIDLDARNAELARERCGMFLDVDELRGPEMKSHPLGDVQCPG